MNEFKIGDTVFHLNEGKVVKETITGIVLYGKVLKYTTYDYKDLGSLYNHQFKPAIFFFETKEELLQSL